MFGKKKETKSIGGTLITGLPVPDKSFVQVILSPDGMKLTAVIAERKTTTQEFNLTLDKIESVRILNETEVRQIVEQSAPGMIVGAAAFGILGAMVGGRVKTKEKTEIKSLLVIKYQSSGDKEIVLDCSSASLMEQSAFLKRYQELKPGSGQNSGPIDL